MGILIFKSLLQREEINRAFCNEGLFEDADAKENHQLSYIDYICMMIAGKKKLLPQSDQGKWDAVPDNRRWLLQIVSNER